MTSIEQRDIDELRYCAEQLHWQMLPLVPGTKRPPFKWDNATHNWQVLQAWFEGQFAGFGYGALTGPESNVLMFDIDGGEGEESLRQVSLDLGPLPDTIESVSGREGGGVHLYFQYPMGLELKTCADVNGMRHLDVRAWRGLGVIPPTLHRSGKRHRWRGAPTWQPLAELPESWVEWLPLRDEEYEPPRYIGEEVTDPQNLPVLEELGDRPGDRYDQRTTWEEVLFPDGWSVEGHSGGETRWTRPGKSPREGCSATTGYKGTDVLKVFTSSVPWLEDGRTYTRFAYYTARHHDGDFSKAARDLMAEEQAAILEMLTIK